MIKWKERAINIWKLTCTQTIMDAGKRNRTGKQLTKCQSYCLIIATLLRWNAGPSQPLPPQGFFFKLAHTTFQSWGIGRGQISENTRWRHCPGGSNNVTLFPLILRSFTACRWQLSFKLRYLLQFCTEAVVKVNMHSSAQDLLSFAAQGQGSR